MAEYTINSEKSTQGDRKGGRKKARKCGVVPRKPREEGVHEGEQCEPSDLLLRSQLRTETGFSDKITDDPFKSYSGSGRIKNERKIKNVKKVETVKTNNSSGVELCKGEEKCGHESLEGVSLTMFVMEKLHMFKTQWKNHKGHIHEISVETKRISDCQGLRTKSGE